MTWTSRLAQFATNGSCTGPTPLADTYGAPQLCDTTTYPYTPDGLAETGLDLAAMGWYAFGGALIVAAFLFVLLLGSARAESKAMKGWLESDEDAKAVADELENMRARYPLEAKPGSKR